MNILIGFLTIILIPVIIGYLFYACNEIAGRYNKRELELKWKTTMNPIYWVSLKFFTPLKNLDADIDSSEEIISDIELDETFYSAKTIKTRLISVHVFPIISKNINNKLFWMLLIIFICLFFIVLTQIAIIHYILALLALIFMGFVLLVSVPIGQIINELIFPLRVSISKGKISISGAGIPKYIEEELKNIDIFHDIRFYYVNVETVLKTINKLKPRGIAIKINDKKYVLLSLPNFLLESNYSADLKKIVFMLNNEINLKEDDI